MVLAEKHVKTCGYVAHARAPHAHMREDNAQKRGKSAALRVDLEVKQTPCKQLARGVQWRGKFAAIRIVAWSVAFPTLHLQQASDPTETWLVLAFARSQLSARAFWARAFLLSA